MRVVADDFIEFQIEDLTEIPCSCVVVVVELVDHLRRVEKTANDESFVF